MHKFRWFAVLVLVHLDAVAADASLDAARHCVAITDSLQRLVCYDRALGDAGTAAALAQPAPNPADVVAAAAVSPARTLGDESLKRNTPSAEARETSLIAKISALKETRTDVYRISLDNGQVWQQMDMDSRFVVKVGDSIEIRKGSMGGYRLGRVGKGSKASNWVRVNRLQ
jgi:hypothetical protein